MCVLIFSTTFVWNISHSKKKWARYNYKRLWYSCKVSDSCQILVKLELSRQTFEKYLHIKFNENQTRGSRVVPCGLIDGRTDMTKLIVAFRNFANAPKNSSSRSSSSSSSSSAIDVLFCTTTCSTFTIIILTYDGILGTSVLLPLSESVEPRKPTVLLFQKPGTKCIFSPNSSIGFLHSHVFSYTCDCVTLRQ
jgi:hypothetical protein